jgi:hypothetical protein
MFQRLTVRLFAGMLLGTAAGILWGVWFQAAKWPLLGSGDEVAQMSGLLEAAMLGAAAGFLVGGVAGSARNSGATSALAGVLSAPLIYLPAGLWVSRPESVREALLVAAAALAGATFVAAVAIPPRKSKG